MALDSDYRGFNGRPRYNPDTMTDADGQTIVCAGFSYFGLPNSPKTAPFLTDEERKVIDEWLLSDNPCAGYVSSTLNYYM